MSKLSNVDLRWRNWGCRIHEIEIGGIPAVTMENKSLRVTVLAGKGAEIYEMLYKPLDLDVLYHGLRTVGNSENFLGTQGNSSFFDRYWGGWQTLFPSIGDSGMILPEHLPFHGEAALSSWKYEIEKNEVDEVQIRFYTRTKRFPYVLEKLVTLTGKGATLSVVDRIINDSDQSLNYEYGQHPALGPSFLDETCEIILPKEPYQVIPAPATDLYPNKITYWPRGVLQNGDALNLSHVFAPADQWNVEFGLIGLKEGKVEIYSKSQKVGFELRWDIHQLPYLWIWEPDYASMGYPFYGRAYCLGVEPWTTLPSFSPDSESTRKKSIGARETVEYAFTASIIEHE